MPSDLNPYTWDEAVGEFLVHLDATRAQKTARFYRVQLRQLIRWACDNAIPFGAFGKRHMDRYLAARAKTVSQTTLHHDGVTAKAFFKWCARNDFLERSPLAEYEVRRAPRPARFMPTDDDMKALLLTVSEFWDPERNAGVRFLSPSKRLFHRVRNYAALLLLIDSACRIGEVLSLQTGDFRPEGKDLVIRESKGREPRTLPVSPAAAEAVRAWLKVREKAMRDADADEGWLFVSEFGTRIEESKFLKNVKAYVRYGKLSEGVTLHSLRRYSLNRLAKTNLLAAQQIAGHKSPQTTLLYTKLDADFVREVHAGTGVLEGVLSQRRPRKKRIV